LINDIIIIGNQKAEDIHPNQINYKSPFLEDQTIYSESDSYSDKINRFIKNSNVRNNYHVFKNEEAEIPSCLYLQEKKNNLSVLDKYENQFQNSKNYIKDSNQNVNIHNNKNLDLLENNEISLQSFTNKTTMRDFETNIFLNCHRLILKCQIVGFNEKISSFIINQLISPEAFLNTFESKEKFKSHNKLLCQISYQKQYFKDEITNEFIKLFTQKNYFGIIKYFNSYLVIFNAKNNIINDEFLPCNFFCLWKINNIEQVSSLLLKKLEFLNSINNQEIISKEKCPQEKCVKENLDSDLLEEVKLYKSKSTKLEDRINIAHLKIESLQEIIKNNMNLLKNSKDSEKNKDDHINNLITRINYLESNEKESKLKITSLQEKIKSINLEQLTSFKGMKYNINNNKIIDSENKILQNSKIKGKKDGNNKNLKLNYINESIDKMNNSNLNIFEELTYKQIQFETDEKNDQYQKLSQQNENLTLINMELQEKYLCIICYENQRDCIYMDCGHSNICISCFNKKYNINFEENRKNKKNNNTYSKIIKVSQTRAFKCETCRSEISKIFHYYPN